MDRILHDHCYISSHHGPGERSPDSQGDSKHKRKSLRDASQSSSNDLIDGLPDGYANNSLDQNNSPEESNHSSTSGKRKLPLESASNGSSPKSRKGNKIHELLFGECDDPGFVDGVQIPDTQTVASDEAKSITTSDFGLYINNPSTYSSVSSEETKAFLSGAERLKVFGTSMSVDSETEVLEAAAALVALSRGPPKSEHRTFKKNKLKPDKVKRTNILKTKPIDIKSQKRKYTKRKGSKKDNAKETYSLWTNGNKYDEFEYYATKPLHRSQCTLSSRKSSHRRPNEPRTDSEETQMNGEVEKEETVTNSLSTKSNEVKPSQSKRKPSHTKTKSKSNKVDNELSTSWEDSQSKSPPQAKKTIAKFVVKEEPSSPIASSSALPDVEVKEEKEDHVDEDVRLVENGVDSDLEAEETSSKVVHPQLLTRPIQRRGKRKSVGSDDDDGNSEDELEYTPIQFIKCEDEEEARVDPWGQACPQNILLHIFSYGVRNEGVTVFIPRVSKVCRLWNNVAADPTLWRVANLSGNNVHKFKKTFRWLCKHRLSRVREINLANWEVLTYKEMELLGKCAPLIESLNLSRCSRITPASLRTLIDNLEHLKHLDLSFATTFIASKFVLDQLIQKRGEQLMTLNCSYNILVKFDTVMTGIIKSCANLQVLDLSNAIFSSCLLPLNIEQMQIGCPLLKKLLMANSLFKAKPVWGASPGFVHLEELNVARSAASHLSKFRYMDDAVLHRFLRTSQRLKTLDVSGCRYVSNEGLRELNIPNLEGFSLSYCRASGQQEIEQTILRWCHSLKELDFSGNSMNGRLMRCILTRCTKLEMLNLSGCKGLPWDKRREFNATELVQLRETMHTWLE